jgi:uncharacterized protein (TIRG00374 family)
MKNGLKVAASLAVTAFFLWLALHGVNWPEVGTHLRAANPLYLGLAVVVSTLAVHVRALRWKALLAPVDPEVALHPRLAGTAIGFAANNLIPARVGELVRAVVTARLAKIPLSAVIASLVVERVLDGLATVALLLGVTALPGFPSPQGAAPVLTAVRVMAALMGTAALVLIGMAMMPARASALAGWFAARLLPARLRPALLGWLDGFMRGLAVLRSPRLLAVSVLWALGQWLFLPLGIYFALLAFGIREPGYMGAVFLQCAINLAVAIPSSPGFFGPLDAAATLGLGLWGVGHARAVSFAIGYHLGGFTTVTLLGLWYLQRLGLGWRELIGTAEAAAEDAESSPEPVPPQRGTDPRP